MNKQKIIIISFSWLIVLVTMFMIFNFSRQDGETSKETSDKVVDIIVELSPNKAQITDQQKDVIRFSVRKLAHFGIYMLLGFTLINAFIYSFKIKSVFNALSSVSFAFLFAVIDEFLIQGNTSGRAPQWTDVLIDTLGSIIGVSFFILIIFIYNKLLIKNKTKNGIL